MHVLEGGKVECWGFFPCRTEVQKDPLRGASWGPSQWHRETLYPTSVKEVLPMSDFAERLLNEESLSSPSPGTSECIALSKSSSSLPEYASASPWFLLRWVSSCAFFTHRLEKQSGAPFVFA